MSVWVVLFWTLLALVAYPYVIYPVILWVWSKVRPRPWTVDDQHQPTVSVIIAAHNEAAVITDKLANTFEQDYPADRLEVIVVSDCSTDSTNDLVQTHQPAVKLVPLTERSGKQLALNQAVAQASGSILVFTDAAVLLDRLCVRRLVRNFADAKVGAVSSVIKIRTLDPGSRLADLVHQPEAREAEGTYLDLDLKVRRLETLVSGAVGCCGSCYAVRRECFVPFDSGCASDFASALDAARLGYRTVMDPEAVGYMVPAKGLTGEFRRKSRTIAGGLDTLWRSKMWWGVQRPIFWWELMSHKVLRWLGPVLLIAAWLVSIIGAVMDQDRFLALAAIGGGFAWFLACIGLVMPRFKPFRYALFAATAVLASLDGWLKFLTGQRQKIWSPTQRFDAQAPVSAAK